jgi:choline dehydrogenase-like flavoprotein
MSSARPTTLPIEQCAPLAHERKPLELDCDVLVVGSGATGSVVAAELAGSGQRVLVLEEGPYLSAAALGRMRPSDSMRRGWREAGMTFALGVGDSPHINIMMGRCVGGSSLMTGGVCFRTPDEVLQEWVDGHHLTDLSPARMRPYFEEVERQSHVETVPAEMRSRATTLFMAGAQKLGFPMSANQRNTEGCCGCSRCNFGCPHQAKLSVDLTYLPRAIAAGARVLSDCRVEEILFAGEAATGVRGRVLEQEGAAGIRRRRFTVRARRIVLAAGAIHSAKLLLDSGLGPGLPALGRNLSVHPSLRVMARFDERVDGWYGALQSAHSLAFFHERLLLMSIFLPAGVLGATLPGVGLDHARRAELAPYMSVFGGMVHDDGGGQVHAGGSARGLLGRLLGREPVLSYALSRRDRRAISRVLRLLGETYLAAGAREIFLPLLGSMAHFGVRPGPNGGLDADELRRLDLDKIPAHLFECASQHPLGTCRMGTSREHAVVDPEGRVFGVRDLYVVDSGVLPTSLGVNPQISVMAMATRLAWRMRDRPLPAA